MKVRPAVTGQLRAKDCTPRESRLCFGYCYYHETDDRIVPERDKLQELKNCITSNLPDRAFLIPHGIYHFRTEFCFLFDYEGANLLEDSRQCGL